MEGEEGEEDGRDGVGGAAADLGWESVRLIRWAARV